MDVIEVVRTMLRRWYVTVPLLLGTVCATWWVYVETPTTHSASAVLLFVGPNVEVRYDAAGAHEIPQNPLTNADGANVAALATAHALLSEQASGALRSAGVDARYAAETDRRNPMLEISTESQISGDARRGMMILIDHAEQQLSNRQEAVGAPPSSRLGFQVLRASAAESTSNGLKTRSALTFAAVGAAMTVAGAAAAEGLARGRRRASGAEPPPLRDRNGSPDAQRAWAYATPMPAPVRATTTDTVEPSVGSDPSANRPSDLISAHDSGGSPQANA